MVPGFAVIDAMHIKGSGIDLVGLYTLACLVNVAFICWASGVAMRFQSVQAGPIMQTPVFLLLFLAPVYVPLKLLQGWIHAIAVGNPITQILESVRGNLAGEPYRTGVAFLCGVGLIVGFSIWAMYSLRNAERSAG